MAISPELNNIVGTTSQEKWTLEVKDIAPRDNGEIVSFGLELDL